MKSTDIIVLAIAGAVLPSVFLFMPGIFGNVNAQTMTNTGNTDGDVITPEGESPKQLPKKDLPIPDAERMFTNDTAQIFNLSNGSLTLDVAYMPKALVAAQPATFVMNLFHTDNGTWLWHSDFKVSITKKGTDEQVLIMPNIHGHGSMVQFTYAFPDPGTYDIGIIAGQQVGSPNYIKPKEVKEMHFTVDVEPQKEMQPGSATVEATGETKEIPVTVTSWAFTPNTIEVNKGDLVRLILTTGQDEVALYNGHGFGIEGYNINAFLVKGTTQTIEFVADKAGTFTFRCTSFCVADAPQENHFSMTGTLVVNE